MESKNQFKLYEFRYCINATRLLYNYIFQAFNFSFTDRFEEKSFTVRNVGSIDYLFNFCNGFIKFFLNPADHLATQLWYANVRLVVICLSPIGPLNGLVSLSVCSRWCAGHEILWERVLLEKKVDMKCMLVNVLKNTARRLISCLIMSHTCFRVNLHSVVSWMSRNSLLETDAISEV